MQGTVKMAEEPIQVNPEHYPIQIISWKINVKDSIFKDQALGVYEYLESGGTSKRNEIRSRFEGKIMHLAAPGQVLHSEKEYLGTILEGCSHAVQLHDLCALCGKDLSIPDYTGSDASRATINMTHDSLGVKVSHKEATRIEMNNVARLQKERKLSLLLDLDQTVVHATVDDVVREWMENPENPDFPALTDVHSFTLIDSPAVYYIKLRPGTRDFLEQLYDKFEMHIYTMGTRDYAHAVANILDPCKKYFQDRILSRDDSGSFVFKNIKRLFPVDQSMVVAIDDRADVWQWSPNLIKVRAYNFFLGIGDINEPMKEGTSEQTKSTTAKTDLTKSSSSTPPSLPILTTFSIPSPNSTASVKNRPKIQDDDNDLKFVKRTMTALHATFFNRLDRNEQGADVCHILPWMKSQILSGVVIVFSGVIPIGHDPQRNELWIQATQFGAVCQLEMNASTTHLIARKAGTAKVNDAIQMACHIVSPEWLINCIIQWNNVSEVPYYIDPSLKGPSIEVGIATVDADWSELDKQVDAFLDATDSDDASSLHDDPHHEKSDITNGDSNHASDGTYSDDDWLVGEIEAELNATAEVESKKRGREEEEEIEEEKVSIKKKL